jgi:hypothetical protein
MAGNHEMQQDIPRFGTANAQSAFLATVQREVANATATPGLLLGFLRDAREMSEPRVCFNLPWSAEAVPLPPSEECVVVPLFRFPTRDALRRSLSRDAVEVFFDGKFLQLDDSSALMLDLLCVESSLDVKTLFERCGAHMTPESTKHSFCELVKAGLVGLIHPSSVHR